MVEITKGRNAAAKLRSAIRKDEVRTNQPAGGGIVVFLDDEDFGAMASLGTAVHTPAPPTWRDVVSAEGHRDGHWFWRRGYTGGEGSVTFDGRPEAHVHSAKAMEIMKKAIDRCFANTSPDVGR